MPGRTPSGAGPAQLPQLEKRPRTTSHAAPSSPMYASQRRSGMKGNATLSTGLMHARASGNVTHALPTTPGLSKHFDLDGLRSGSSSPSLLRPLLSGVAHWQEDDKALYGGVHYSWKSGYDSEIESTPVKRQHTALPSRENDLGWGQESDTRFGWPTRFGAGNPMQQSSRRRGLEVAGDEDWDGHILHREFQEKVAQARQGSSNPDFRFEPIEGGLGGDGASGTNSPGRGAATVLDLETLTSKVEQVIDDRRGPRPFPDDLRAKHEYFLQASGSLWPRLTDDSSAKMMPFDIVEEVQVYTDMLERAINMVEVRIPGCGAVLRKSFEWFVQVPVDKVMLARKDDWRRPHRDAFHDLEDKAANLAKDAREAQNAAVNAEEMSRAALTQVKESSERTSAAEKAHRMMEVELKTTQKSAASRLEEATVAKAYSNKQAENMTVLRADYEKTLRDLTREERLRKTADESNTRLTARVEDLEAQVNDYVRQLKGTRAAKRAKKIERRSKIVLGELQEIERKARLFNGVINQEGERMNKGLGLSHNLDRAMQEARNQDRALAEKEVYLGGGPTVKGETETLVKIAGASGAFADEAIEAVEDSTTCITNLDKMIEGFNMADQLPDSDSDGETAELERLKKDNDLLREKQFNNEQTMAVKDRELVLRQESIDHLKGALRMYGDWQKKVENEVTKIKEDCDRQLRAKEEEMDKIKLTMQEMKIREQEFKEQVRALEKDVAAKDKEISQFESKLLQFKNKVETLTKENEAKAQKISTMENEIADLKAEIQQLKDDARAMQTQIKELNARVHDLEVELAVERETVAKLRIDIEEYKRQIKMHEERAREHAAELKRVKDAAAKAAEEAKLREQKLQREKKELEDKMAQMQREFKAKIAELEKQLEEAIKQKEAALARNKELQAELEDVKEKFTKSAAEITKWKDMATKSMEQADVFRKKAADAEKKVADAAAFMENYDKFQSELERMKEFERMYQRAMRECEELKQELEFLKNNTGKGSEEDFEEPDDELLAGMESKAKRKGKGGGKKKGKTFALPNNSGVLGPWIKPKEPRSRVKQQDEAASKVMLARMLSKMLESDDTSEDAYISDKLEGFVRIADEHLHQTTGGNQSMSEVEVQEAMQEMGFDHTIVKQAMSTVVGKKQKAGTRAPASGDASVPHKEPFNKVAGGLPSAAMLERTSALQASTDASPEATHSAGAGSSMHAATPSTQTTRITSSPGGVHASSSGGVHVESGHQTVAENRPTDASTSTAMCLSSEPHPVAARSSPTPHMPGAGVDRTTHAVVQRPAEKITAAQRRAADLEQRLAAVEEPMLDKRDVVEVLATAQALTDWKRVDTSGEGSLSNEKVIAMLEDQGFSAPECEDFIHRVDPKQSGVIAQEQWLAESTRRLSTTVEVKRTFAVSVAGTELGQPHITKQKLKSKADGEFAHELLLNRMLQTMGEPAQADQGVPARIAEFSRAANHQFENAAENGHMDGDTAEEVMAHLGIKKEIVQEALTSVNKGKGAWLDKNSFANALSTAQSLSAWHKIDFDRKGSVSTTNVTDFLEDCGYSAAECEEIAHRLDRDKGGSVYQQDWVNEWNKHLSTTIEAQTSIPATAVAQVSGVGVSSTKISGRLIGAFRHATQTLKQASRATVAFTRAKPQASTQTSDIEAMGRDPRDPSVAGGGAIGLQPTPMGRLLEMKDQEIIRAELNYEAAVDQIAQLLGFIKARTDHQELHVENLRAQIESLRARLHPNMISQGTITPRLEAPQVAGMVPSQPEVTVQVPIERLAEQSPSQHTEEWSSTVPVESFPPFNQIYRNRSEHSVRVGRARTKLRDLVKEFHRGSADPPGPRSILWLTKILHGILASKIVCDAVDSSMDLPVSSYAAFCADWMRNRFGVDGLVKKACLELESSLQFHRDKSVLVELVSDFFDGKYTSAEQRVFLHCYTLVGDYMDRQRLPREAPHAREISLPSALDILHRVLPYASELHQNNFKELLLEAVLDDESADMSADFDDIMVQDHYLFDLVVKERIKVQELFRAKIASVFQQHDPDRRGLLSYDDVNRMLQDLVPWSDTRQLHAAIGNICPDLLAPGAVIDISNLIILDERIDFMGCKVNGFKVKES